MMRGMGPLDATAMNLKRWTKRKILKVCLHQNFHQGRAASKPYAAAVEAK